MAETLFGLVVALGFLLAYHAGKRAERKQVHGWLRFLHDGDEDFTLQGLAAMVSVGQHYDWEGD